MRPGLRDRPRALLELAPAEAQTGLAQPGTVRCISDKGDKRVTRWPLAGAVQVPSGVLVTSDGFGASGGDQDWAGSRFFLPVPAASTVHRLIVPATKTL